MDAEMTLKLQHLEAKLVEQEDQVSALKLINSKLSRAFTDAYMVHSSNGTMTKSQADVLLQRMNEAKTVGESTFGTLQTKHDEAEALRQSQVEAARRDAPRRDEDQHRLTALRHAVAPRKTMSLDKFRELKSNKGDNFFITEGEYKGKLNRLKIGTIIGSEYSTLALAEVKAIMSDQVYDFLINDNETDVSSALRKVAISILQHHPELNKSGVAATPLRAPEVNLQQYVGTDVSEVGGGGGLEEHFKLVKKISDITKQIEIEFIKYEDNLRSGLAATREEKKLFYNTPNIMRLTDEIKKIQEQLKMYMSNRSTRGAQATKIDITAEMITEAVAKINSDGEYTIPEGFPSSGTPVTNLRKLREYILDNIKNDAVFLTLMTTDLGLNLNAVLPEYNPVVVEEQLSTLNKDGILLLGTDKYPMPNFQGDPKNRKSFSKLYDKDTCFGFGPTKHNSTCTSLLLDCINGDTEQCRNLLAKDEFKNMIEDDMKSTNVFMIAKLLDNIGYPRVEKGIKFDPDMNNWYSKIQTVFSLDASDVAQNKTLKGIKENGNLKIALEHMIRKYNKYANVINKTNSQIKLSSLPAVYGKGGNASAALLAYDGYNTTGGSLEILDGKNRNFNAIFKMAKELKDNYDLTKEYTKLFTNTEHEIKRNNIVLPDNTKNEYTYLLESFKTSEVKLNKLLQLFTNFAFLLNRDDRSDAGSNEFLNSLITRENMTKYVAARDKIMNSINKRKTQMTIMSAPWGPVPLVQ